MFRFLGDVILQQFEALPTLECRNEEFLSFQPVVNRLDTFLCGWLSRANPVAWAFWQKLLLLSHGQASVERGFSVNKEVETDNMQEETMVAHWLVCDYVDLHGGVPLTKELLVSVGAARSRYCIFLDQQQGRRVKHGHRKESWQRGIWPTWRERKPLFKRFPPVSPERATCWQRKRRAHRGQRWPCSFQNQTPSGG